MNKMFTNHHYVVAFIVLIGACGAAVAAADKKPAEYKDPTGVSIEYETTGSGQWIRIRAIGESICIICDPRDINVATRKAELRAKAAIAKFLKEKISTNEVMNETVKTITENNGETETVNRKTLEIQVETIQNSAEAILKGLLTIEQNSDPAKKTATVTVGVSRKTMATADSINRALVTDTSSPKAKANANAIGATMTPDAQIRRSKQADTF